MQHIHPEVVQVFGNKVRARVCGILIEKDHILLVNHHGLNKTNLFWCPPGGGIQFGESARESLQREFREETGLEIEVMDFLCVNEYISQALQAVELFFLVKPTGGHIATGTDPELKQQIIKEVKFMTIQEIRTYQPEEVHNLFRYCTSLADIYQLQGKYLVKNM